MMDGVAFARGLSAEAPDKMHDIHSRAARFFRSHDMAAITRLCKRVATRNGRIVCDGEPHRVSIIT